VLTDPVFANPLLIHVSVLLALFSQPVINAPGGSPRTKVLQRLLSRERKRWTDSLPGAGLDDLSDNVAAQAVTVATLTGPRTRADAVKLLQAVPDLADASLERRGRIADWLHQLYPDEAGYVAPLRPDLLAEQQLADTPDLAKLTVNVYQHTTSSTQVERLLAELTQAANAHRTVNLALNQLLDAHLPELLDQALKAPTSPTPGLLSRALQIVPHPEAATQLIDRLPRQSTALATLAATISAQALQHYRTLAEADPDAHLSHLATALNNLGIRLAGVGRQQEALATFQEAATIRRQLAEANPDAYLPDLAKALTNLGELLSRVGRPQEALATTQEAVTTYRSLAEADPDAYLPDLAMALGNLGIRLAEIGRQQEALAAIQETVTTFRRLAEANPDAYLPDVAKALNNLGELLSRMGRPQEALATTQEAATIRRQLAETNPDAYLPDLAMALNNLGGRLAEVGEPEEALAAFQEAVTIRRQLAEANPDVNLPDLAMALNNLGELLSEVGRPEEALAPTREAVTTHRSLAEANPDVYLSRLAASLNNLRDQLTAAGRNKDVAVVQEELASVLERMGGHGDDNSS
jgi:tetratricopeptide (TPR) repeat protein